MLPRAAGQTPRPYRMVARAEAAAATAERILQATADVFWESPTPQVSLEDVARRAGVTVQTILRRFGSRAGLMAATVDRESAKVQTERDRATPGSVEEAVTVLVEHYEEAGHKVLRMLAEEARIPALKDIVDRGRLVHREWCARVFEPTLAHLAGRARERRLAELVAICDVYTWKLLRLDAGLSRSETELALREILTPLLEVT